MKRRQDDARQILLDELRKGEKTLHQIEEVDELAAMVYRYSRAAQEGAARLNIRLMAKVIAGQFQAGALVADEFLAYADMLGSLRRDEVILIAVLYSFEKEGGKGFSPAWVWDKAKELLIPKLFEDNGLMIAAGYATARTGLVIPTAEWSKTSELMHRVEALASFQQALREEGIDLEGDHGRP